MRRTTVRMNLTARCVYGGGAIGYRVEVGTRGIPMSVLHAIRNLPFQWRARWAGPTSPEAPVMRVLWGWFPEPSWTPGLAHVRHDGPTPRIRWSISRAAIRLHTAQDALPLGRWDGTLTCEPDELAPVRIALDARPTFYVPRNGYVPTSPPTPDPLAILPSLELP